MPDDHVHDPSRSARADAYTPADAREGPGLIDGLRFLYRRRAALAVRFIVLLGVGVIALVVFVLTSATSVKGTLALTFKGIERHEYPNGRKFSAEAFRSPDVLKRALADVAIPEERLDVRRLSAGVYVTPVIPADVQARWRRQERDGTRKDEYFPSEYHLSLQVKGLTTAQDVRLFDAIVKNYQARVKYEQRAALSFVGGGWNTSYETLAGKYDFWDIPALFAETSRSLEAELAGLITESLQYEDPKYQLGFRDLARELGNWRTIRLAALEALTYQGRLVKNKELTLQRMQHRLDDIDVLIKQKTHEASEGLRLLALIDRPNAAIAGRLTERGAPVVDVSALEKLLKNDYVAPVVVKVSKLQSEAQELEAERARLHRSLGFLPKAVNLELGQLPPGHRELVQTLSSELQLIVQNYNRLLDEYLTNTVTSLVSVKQAPIVVRENSSWRMLGLLLIGVVLLSAFLAIVAMSVEHLFQRLHAETVGGHPRTAP